MNEKKSLLFDKNTTRPAIDFCMLTKISRDVSQTFWLVYSGIKPGICATKTNIRGIRTDIKYVD